MLNTRRLNITLLACASFSTYAMNDKSLKASVSFGENDQEEKNLSSPTGCFRGSFAHKSPKGSLKWSEDWKEEANQLQNSLNSAINDSSGRDDNEFTRFLESTCTLAQAKASLIKRAIDNERTSHATDSLLQLKSQFETIATQANRQLKR